MSNLGISTDDIDQIISDMTRTISFEKATKTVDPQSGEETTTYAAAANKSVIFFLNQNRWVWDKEGLVQLGDAYLIANKSLSFAKHDRFSIDGSTYIIDNVNPRYVLKTSMMDFCICIKVV